MTKTLDHDSFIDGVFYKAGSPVPPRKTAPQQVSEDLTDTMTVEELIDHFRSGKGPKGAAAIIELLDDRSSSLADLSAKLDAANSSDTDAAQLIADANKERDEAFEEVKRLEAEIADLKWQPDAASPKPPGKAK